MSEVFSIQIHNRQLFEQGKQGVWLELPTTADRLQEAMRQVVISTDNPQDFFINGYSSPEDRRLALPYDMVLSAGVDELNYLAARLEPLAPAEVAELNAALTRPHEGFASIGQIIDYPDNVEYFIHLPGVDTPSALGDYYLHKSGMVEMPEEWKGGIDPYRFGSHIAKLEQGQFTPYGYLVNSGDEWQRVHEGQPVPEQYRVMSLTLPQADRTEQHPEEKIKNPVRVNQGYTILESVEADGVEFVLGENPKAVQPFVTWRRLDGGGPTDFTWGHYFTDYQAAKRDLMGRAKEHLNDRNEGKPPYLRAKLRMAQESRPASGPHRHTPEKER